MGSRHSEVGAFFNFARVKSLVEGAALDAYVSYPYSCKELSASVGEIVCMIELHRVVGLTDVMDRLLEYH